jgi:5-methylcytosine-specific restriction endonuclease McrA
MLQDCSVLQRAFDEPRGVVRRPGFSPVGRLGEEPLEDLKIICRPCHDKEHGRDEETERKYYDPRRFE